MAEYFIKLLFSFFFIITQTHSIFCSQDVYKHYDTGTWYYHCDLDRGQSILIGDPTCKQSAHILIPSYDTITYTNCTITVRTFSGYSLFAKIQKMSLESGPSGKCIDYIQFTSEGVGTKFCGKVDENIPSAVWNYGIKLDQFKDPPMPKTTGIYSVNGEIDVSLIISEKNSEKHLQNNLVIVFTSVKVNGREFYGDKPNSGNGITMQKEYLCDGIKNCPVEDMCNDEMDCSTIFTTIITIVAIVGILLFAVTLASCKYFYQNQNPNNPNQATPDLYDNDDFIIPNITNEQAVYTIPSPSDTPPKYDTLFPHLATISRDDLNKNTNPTDTPATTNPSSS